MGTDARPVVVGMTVTGGTAATAGVATTGTAARPTIDVERVTVIAPLNTGTPLMREAVETTTSGTATSEMDLGVAQATTVAPATIVTQGTEIAHRVTVETTTAAVQMDARDSTAGALATNVDTMKDAMIVAVTIAVTGDTVAATDGKTVAARRAAAVMGDPSDIRKTHRATR